MAPGPRFDRQQPDEQEERATRILFERFGRLDDWHGVVDALVARPRTVLAGDDRATSYETVSELVRSNLVFVLDHFDALKLMIQDGQSLMTMAPLTLLRAALESTGLAMWLIGSEARDERVLRALQAAYEANIDVIRAEAELSGVTPTSGAPVDAVKRLEELRDARPTLRGKNLKPPSISERLGDTKAYFDSGRYSLLGLWKVASGMAHGRRAMMIHLLDFEQLSVGEETVHLRATSSVSLVAGLYSMCEAHMVQVLARFNTLNIPR